MSHLFFLFLLTIFIIFLNKYLISLNFLVSETGDRHQKFASNKIVPLTGGSFIFKFFIFHYL